MEKYKIQINIEFNAKDFLQAKKVKGKIDECILLILLREECVASRETILQRMERSGHE